VKVKTHKNGGTGLGLTLVKMICEKLGGCLEIKSTEGKGSVFACDVPFSSYSCSEGKV
ncbi:MAG: ATP-binding protein, partial [Planctomycetes bacterium]|nr:ATP-binding protein [Planctomycetota bacterium]